ncbi:MAG: hypothetical protein ACD_61C00054G0003 [uncultured bacterium]|nr:MAG: hypothetical protein ACD_61C00054G0003 [uncultured bacterium]
MRICTSRHSINLTDVASSEYIMVNMEDLIPLRQKHLDELTGITFDGFLKRNIKGLHQNLLIEFSTIILRKDYCKAGMVIFTPV